MGSLSGKLVAIVTENGFEEVELTELNSFHSIKTDLINAGTNWVDQECVK